MNSQKQKRRRRFAVKEVNGKITATIYLFNGTVVKTIVDDNGNVETIVEPP